MHGKGWTRGASATSSANPAARAAESLGVVVVVVERSAGPPARSVHGMAGRAITNDRVRALQALARRPVVVRRTAPVDTMAIRRRAFWHERWRAGGKPGLKAAGRCRSAAEGDRGPARQGGEGPRARAEGQRIPDRSVDARPGDLGDRGRHRCAPPPRARLAGSAPDGLEPPCVRPGGPSSATTRPSSGGRTSAGPRYKNPGVRDAWIVFQDESGFNLIPSVRSTWAPRGRTPVLHHHFCTGSACRCPRQCACGPTAPTAPSCSASRRAPTTTSCSWSSSPGSTATSTATR